MAEIQIHEQIIEQVFAYLLQKQEKVVLTNSLISKIVGRKIDSPMAMDVRDQLPGLEKDGYCIIAEQGNFRALGKGSTYFFCVSVEDFNHYQFTSKNFKYLSDEQIDLIKTRLLAGVDKINNRQWYQILFVCNFMNKTQMLTPDYFGGKLLTCANRLYLPPDAVKSIVSGLIQAGLLFEKDEGRRHLYHFSDKMISLNPVYPESKRYKRRSKRITVSAPKAAETQKESAPVAAEEKNETAIPSVSSDGGKLDRSRILSLIQDLNAILSLQDEVAELKEKVANYDSLDNKYKNLFTAASTMQGKYNEMSEHVQSVDAELKLLRQYRKRVRKGIETTMVTFSRKFAESLAAFATNKNANELQLDLDALKASTMQSIRSFIDIDVNAENTRGSEVVE